MPLYRYHALNGRGDALYGYVFGATKRDAISKLRNTQIDLISLKRRFQIRKKHSDVVLWFFLHLEYSLRAGIPLAEALSGIAMSFRGEFRAVVSSLYNDLTHGQLLSQACENFPAFFSPLLCALIRLGEQSGKLPESCTQIQNQLSQEVSQRQVLAKALRYPMVGILASLVAGFCLMSFLLPELVTILKENDVPIPRLTQSLLFIATLPAHTILTSIGVGSAILFGAYAFFLPASKVWVDRIGYTLPLARFRAQKQYSDFFQALAVLSKEHIPLMSAFPLAKDAMTSSYLRKQLNYVQQRVLEGERLSDAMRSVPFLTSFHIQMILAGEMTGNLSSAFFNVHRALFGVVSRTIERWVAWVDPLLTLFSSVFILFLVGATLFPLYEYVGRMPNGS